MTPSPASEAAALWREFADLAVLQELLNDFASLTGITVVIIGPDKAHITKQTRPYNRFCAELMKTAPGTKGICEKCDMRWGQIAERAQIFKVYTCQHGLIDFVAPIFSEGHAMGYLFGGQVRLAPSGDQRTGALHGGPPELLDAAVENGELVALPEPWYARHAASLGIDAKEFLSALDEIQVMPREKIEAAARLLNTVASSISTLIASRAWERRSAAGLEQEVAGLVLPEKPSDQLREAAERIAQIAVSALGADLVQIYHQLPGAAEFSWPPVTVGEGRRRLPDELSARIVRSVRSSEQPEYGVLETRGGQEGSGSGGDNTVVSWAAFPIRSGGRTLGILVLVYGRSREIRTDQELQQRAVLVTARAGILIENALLRLQLRSRSAEIQDEVGAARARRVAGWILAELRERVEYTSASLQAIRGDTRRLLAGSGFDDQVQNRRLLAPIHRDPLISRVVKGRQPLVLSHAESDPHWNTGETQGVRSWIGVPVVYQNEVIALFTLDHAQSGFYSDSHVPLLSSFAEDVASRIWHARLWDSTERLIRDMEIVNEVGAAMSAKLDPKTLFQDIATQIVERLDCTHCTVFLAEGQGEDRVLVPKVTYGGGASTARRFKPGDDSIAGWVFKYGHSVVIPDADRDPRYAASSQTGKRDRSMVAAPIRVGDQKLGVITADQDALFWFSDSDRRLLKALAWQAGSAIQRSIGLKLLEKVASRIIGLEDVGAILEEVVSGAIELTNTTTGVIYLVSKDGRTLLDSFHPKGYAHPRPRLDEEYSLTRTVMRNGQLVRIPDIATHPLVNPVLRKDFRSMIVVPLKIADESIGVFYLNDEESHQFTEIETSLLETLAFQAAVAIQKATNLRDQRKLHSALEDVLENLAIGQEDQERALKGIGEGIRQILGEEVSPTINLFDRETGRFRECHAYGPLASELAVPPRSSGGTGCHVLKTREPLFLKDVGNPPPGCPTVRPESLNLGIMSFAAIPLTRLGEIVGALFINSQKALRFDEETQRVLAIFARQAGLAIEIAQFQQSADIHGAIAKAADLGYVASGIAHEFNGYLQQFGSLVWEFERSCDAECRLALTREFKEAITRADKMIDTFRSFGDRVDTVEDVDLPALVNALFDVSRHRATRDHIQLERGRIEVGKVRVNGSLVQSVVTNLLRNAMTAVVRKEAERRVRVELLGASTEGGPAIEIVVSDSGPGISPEQKSKIFMPFYTAGGSRGLGLGLYLVQRIVTAMQGRIRVETNPWGGATFEVLLPVESARTKESGDE